MVDTRLRIPLPRLFECFVEVVAPNEETKTGPTIKRSHPEEFQEKNELLGQVPTFCFPCRTDSPGVQYFTFVLTDIDGKFRFGFCRYPAHAPSCICIISYAPWFEMFYAILNNISEAEIKGNHDLVIALLDALHSAPIPDVGSSFKVTAKLKSDGSKTDYKFDVPDTTKLPTIPENRNLTDYFAVVTPEIMVQLFVSILFERRILVTSKKLSLVTAIVHGSVSLLYPMQWQHIFVPVLPPKLLDYCCAPMPFLLGVHSSMMDAVRRMPLDDVVILDVDKNELSSPFDDMDVFPQEVSSRLLSRLKKIDRALDDYVASQFLRALVKVIGGYRDALRFKEQENGEGGKIVFDEDSFLVSRSNSIKPFLEQILHLQSFMQFVAGRLDLLNAGIEIGDIFEQEILNDSGDTSKWKFQHQQWVNRMKKGGGALKKTVGIQYAFLKGKANDMELKSKVKSLYKGAKSGVKTGYKGAKLQFKEIKHQLKTKDSHDHLGQFPDHLDTVKRTESMPSKQLANVNASPFRHSMYSTLPSHRIHRGPRDVRQKGSHLAPHSGLSRSTSTDCISPRNIDNVITENEENGETRLQRRDSHSTSDIIDLIDLKTTSNYVENPEKGKTILAQANPSFHDDQFLIIDHEDLELEQKSVDVLEQSRNSNSSWVTFDDDNADKNIKPANKPSELHDPNSPITELSYEDLFRRDASDNFVIISPGKLEIDSTGLYGADQSPYQGKPVANDPLPLIPDQMNSSLLTDALSSMSDETRSLFTKPRSAEETNLVHEDKPSLETNPFHVEEINQEKKKRRPPPRPPPPSAKPGPGSIKRPPNVSLPPRNIPVTRPIPPRNAPELAPTAFDELKYGSQSRTVSAPVRKSTDKDPFAELLQETRNGIAQNITKK